MKSLLAQGTLQFKIRSNYQLDAIECLCTFSSTCFGLIRPSSGAMDVTVSLHMQHMVSLVQLGVSPEKCVCWWRVAVQWMLQFLYICSIWCPWRSQVSVLRSVCAGGVLQCNGCYSFFTYAAYGVLGVVRCQP